MAARDEKPFWDFDDVRADLLDRFMEIMCSRNIARDAFDDPSFPRLMEILRPSEKPADADD